MKERKSNIELLRIIAMIMIISGHYFWILMNRNFGSVPKNNNYYLVSFFESIFIVGVNLFVLITGYFMIDKIKVNTRKIVTIITTTIFYSIIIYLIINITNKEIFSIKEFIKSIFSIIFYSEYWFIKTYIVLYLLIPFINIGLRNLNKNMFNRLLFILIIIFSVWPSFLPYSPDGRLGQSIMHFVVLYCIGAYLKLYFYDNKKRVWIIRYFIFCIMTFICSISKIIPAAAAWGNDFIFNICSSVCLFIYFSKINIKSKFINELASLMFGVYVIHINRYVAPILYSSVDKYSESSLLLINLTITTLYIFSICSIIDLFRKKIIFNNIKKCFEKVRFFNS